MLSKELHVLKSELLEYTAKRQALYKSLDIIAILKKTVAGVTIVVMGARPLKSRPSF